MSLRRVLCAVWRWSWLLTLPISIAFVAWVRVTWQRYHTFRVEQATLEGFPLRDVGAMTLGEMVRHLEVAWTRAGDYRPLPALRTLDLHVPTVGLARLDADLPHSGSQFVEAVLGSGGQKWRAEVRYRGDNVYHWGYAKKSFRVKTKRGQLFEGMRAFNLIVPRTKELLNNYAAYRLAHRLGLIAPRVELVELRVNGAIRGVHVLTEQLDESTLRSQSYMPGDLYSGDAVALRAYVGIANDLFRYPALWEKQAANNHYELTSRAPLEALLAVVNAAPSEARHARLRELVDLDAFAAFSALEILSATIHVDTEHNWRLFYDANRGRFVPVVWDLFGWDASNAPDPGQGPRLDVLSSPMHAVLHADAGFLAARQRILARFFASGEHATFLQAISADMAAVQPAVERDPELTMQVRSVRPAAVVTAMQEMRQQIARLWQDIEDAYTRPREPVTYWRTERGIAFLLRDRVPITRVRLSLNQAARPGAAAVAWRRFGEQHQTDISASTSGHGTEVTIDVALSARHVLQIDSMRTFEVKVNRAVLRPAAYELLIEGVDPATVIDVRCERGGGAFESAVPGTPRELVDLGDVWRPVEPRAVRLPRVWRGRVELAGVTVIDDPLVIEPGTVVRLAPAASLVLRQRVLARGTAAAPIRFEPTDDKPWGVIALQGQDASGSQFVHCELRDGSGYKTPLFEYSAMLSIHDVRDVLLSHCHLRDSRIVDDMLHTVYADLRVTDCSFTGALADAVDLDISHATFERCTFEKSGNDGLDLMTASALVVDCIFRGCGDKGISVGEDSRLLAVRPKMVQCNFGVQSKDDSTAALIHAELFENKVAIDAYKKNWRYGHGGRVFAYNSSLLRNGKTATADKDSRVLLRDCQVDVAPPTAGQVVVDGHATAGPVRRDADESALLRHLEVQRDDR